MNIKQSPTGGEQFPESDPSGAGRGVNPTGGRRRIRRRPSKRVRKRANAGGGSIVHGHDSRLVFGRSWYAEWKVIAVLIVCAVLFVIGTYQYPFITVQPVDIAGFGKLPLPLLGLPPLTVLVYLVHRHFDRQYVIAPDHCEARRGRLSLALTDTRIDYENVRGVEFDQGIVERILDVGDLKIGSSMHSDVELNMTGIRHPDLYRSLIETRIREHFSHLTSGDGSEAPQARRHGKTLLENKYSFE